MNINLKECKLKSIIKIGLKKIIGWFVNHLDGSVVGRYIYAQILDSAMNRTQVVTYADVRLTFAIPNALNRYRSDTFSTKEPETLEWIDGIPSDAVLWDIGANVGLYSCYCAKQRGCRVYAFEPSVFNLELLARNIYLNGLTQSVTIVPLPLSESLTRSTLNMTSMDWGGALSTFDKGYGHDGEAIRKVFEFPTIGLSMTDAVKLLNIPVPDYIKMDVDGIEHLILKGGMDVLRKASEVLIEINDQFDEQANDANKYLLEAGFVLKEKRHAEYFDQQQGSGKHTFNQIWVLPQHLSA
jgi:FkbM family methyltransferase